MQITYELTEQDFVESFLAHRNSKSLQKWAIRCLAVIICLMVPSIAIMLLVERNLAALKTFAPFLGLSLLWLWLLWGAVRWAARKQFRQQPGAQGPRTLAVDDFGMHWKWNGGAGDIEWKNYVRWVEGKKQFLFYISPVSFNIVPKRALSPEQTIEFREMLNRHIASTK